MKILKAEFIKSGTKEEHWPIHNWPEIAVAGKSNVGKSSLINCLTSRKKLVKTSGKPGATQTINFFNVNDALCLVDLPGYGFAKVSKKERATWGVMIDGYLNSSQHLMGLIVIMDIRRGPEEDDKMLIHACANLGIQPIIVFTKGDKFSRNQRFQRRQELSAEFGEEAKELLLFSATEGFGRDELWDRIRQLTGIEDPGAK